MKNFKILEKMIELNGLNSLTFNNVSFTNNKVENGTIIKVDVKCKIKPIYLIKNSRFTKNKAK